MRPPPLTFGTPSLCCGRPGKTIPSCCSSPVTASTKGRITISCHGCGLGQRTLLQQSSVVPWHAFAEALTGANGRRIVFLDTCHAGNAFNRRFLSDGYEANITFYSSAGPDQDAQENSSARRRAWAVHLCAGGGRERRGARWRGRGAGPMACAISSRAAWARWPRGFRAAQEPQYFRARDAENYVLARPE